VVSQFQERLRKLTTGDTMSATPQP
jgi:hypothetical protein